MIFVNDFSPEIVNIGPLMIHWYGLFFVCGLILSYIVSRWTFRKTFGRGKAVFAQLESMALYLIFGLIIGARLGHVLFYNAGYFFAHPVDILKIWNGGLSSHGAVIGIFFALLIWYLIHKRNLKGNFGKYADALCLGFPLAAMFVRIGNFFNSEIVGIFTDGNWGVVFKRLGETMPRHPVQLYEALLNLVIFIVMLQLFKIRCKKSQPWFFVFFYILTYFSGRFVLEFWKDLHVLPADFPLSMGQVLSIPLILIGIGYFCWAGWKRER